MARALRVPRSLFTTRVAKASPSQSSQMIRMFFVTWRARSNTGSRSWTLDSRLSVMRM